MARLFIPILKPSEMAFLATSSETRLMNFKLKDLSTLLIWEKAAESLQTVSAIIPNILSTFDGVTSMKTANDRSDHRETLGRKTIGKVVAGRITMRKTHGFKYGIPYSLCG